MVEIIPKKKREREAPSYLNNILFFVFLSIFIISLSLFLIFKVQTGRYQKETEDLSAQLQLQKGSKEFRQLERKMLTYRDKFKNISKILALYYQPSKIFNELLNKTIHPKIVLKSFVFTETDNGEPKIEISGYAPNKESLAQQIKIYESIPEVQRVDFKGAKVEKEGNLKFTLSIFLSSEYLTPQQ